MKKLLLITATVFFIQTSNAQTFDYFGQTPPGNEAIKFAPNIISLSNRLESQIVFSQDGKEAYIAIDGSAGPGKIYCKKYINNSWQTEEEVSFSKGKNIVSPFLSSNGNTLFFSYWNTDWSDGNIYKVERTVDGWNDPQLVLSPINSTSNDWGYVETSDKTIYFTSNRLGDHDIWVKKPSSDQAENLGSLINSNAFDAQPCVAPDNSYLIFSSFRPELYGNQDLFISFRKNDDEWTKPINMETIGAKINLPNQHQGCPSLSPDGKYLFFFRHNEEGTISDIYWVSTQIIDILKKIAMPTVSVKYTIEQGVMLYPNPTNGHITLSLGTSQNKEAFVEIYNLQGAQVFSKTFQNTPSATIDLTGNSAGMYVVKVIADGVSYEEKIVKE